VSITDGHPGAGRFAPSPTSDLHLGNLRTALLAWAFARRDQLRFLVRIDDLDQQRVAAAPTVARRQLQDLSALGLEWDEPPVRQSERLELYWRALSPLDVFECFCSRREIAAAAQAPHDGVRRYPGTCAHLSTAQRNELRLTRDPALRVRAHGVSVTAHDRHAGAVISVVDDFVVQRGDGTPAYHLAVVVDDGEQGITQVTRGADLLESAPRHVWLAAQLGYPEREYIHVGLAMNAHGDRLAKRDGAVTLAELGAQGTTSARVLRMLGETLGVAQLRDPQELLALSAQQWDALTAWQSWTAPV
jgi:glutamyl-tRNA synthetase